MRKEYIMLGILVVDDCLFSSSILVNSLKKNGYENIFQALDSYQAVNYFKKHKPDLIILDVTMPNRAGIEALKAIIAYDNNANVLMMSAMGQEETVLNCIKMGVKDFIVKPFRIERFIKVVDRMLEGA